jgi:hypothetical protein
MTCGRDGFECLCELRAGVELPRWYRLLEYCCAGLPISLPEGKGRLRRLAFHVRDGKNARTSIHLILPILRDRRLSSLSIPLTNTTTTHRPITDDDEPHHHRLFARASALHLRPVTLLPLLCSQNYRSCRYDYDDYYYYYCYTTTKPLLTTAFTALYSIC